MSSSALTYLPGSGKRMLGPDLEIESEFSYEDYEFKNKLTGDTIPILPPVSDSQREGGLCAPYSTIDTCQSAFVIREATKPSSEMDYFGNMFTEKFSVQQLVDTKLEFRALYDYMVSHGVTTEKYYEILTKQREDGRLEGRESDLFSCPRFSMDKKKVFTEYLLHVTPEMIDDMEKKFDLGEVHAQEERHCPWHIRTRGPVTGAFEVSEEDASNMCEVPLYIRSKKRTYKYINNKARITAHGVMFIGYGIARHVKTKERISYYVFQNNWGKEDKFIGRIPCSKCLGAIGPIFDGLCDLEKFRKEGGNQSMSLVLKDIRGTE